METLQGDHRTMCRFTGLDDSNFEKVQRVIGGYVHEIEVSARVRPGMLYLDTDVIADIGRQWG